MTLESGPGPQKRTPEVGKTPEQQRLLELKIKLDGALERMSAAQNPIENRSSYGSLDKEGTQPVDGHTPPPAFWIRTSSVDDNVLRNLKARAEEVVELAKQIEEVPR